MVWVHSSSVSSFSRTAASYDFRHFYTSNISVARSLLDKEPSGFSTDFPSAAFEDAELAYRLTRHGLRIHYRSAPRAVHYHPYVASSFFARQERCGEMAALFYSKFPELRKWFELRYIDKLRGQVLLAEVVGEGGRNQSEVRGLATLEARALRLAEFYERKSAPPLDGLLRALFRYGYLKGAARGVYPGRQIVCFRSCSSARSFQPLPSLPLLWTSWVSRSQLRTPFRFSSSQRRCGHASTDSGFGHGCGELRRGPCLPGAFGVLERSVQLANLAGDPHFVRLILFDADDEALDYARRSTGDFCEVDRISIRERSS